jgi:hypothetical protein
MHLLIFGGTVFLGRHIVRAAASPTLAPERDAVRRARFGVAP